MNPTNYSIAAICIAIVGLFYNVLKSPKEEHDRVVERSKTFAQQVRRFFVRTLNLLPYVASIGLFVWYGAKVSNSSVYTGTDVMMLVVGAFLTLVMFTVLAFIRFGRMVFGRIVESQVESTQQLTGAMNEIRSAFAVGRGQKTDAHGRMIRTDNGILIDTKGTEYQRQIHEPVSRDAVAEVVQVAIGRQRQRRQQGDQR